VKPDEEIKEMKVVDTSYNMLPGQETKETNVTAEEARAFANMQYIDLRSIKMGKEIGIGQGGVVHLAEYQSQPVAVKRLKDFSLTGEELKQFEKEVAILVRIPTHPGVVAFKGVAKASSPVLGDQFCLILEYCEGGSLLKYMKSGAKITEKQTLEWLLEICNGLSHLHKYGIIHRDIAARNILLSKDLHSKISDFGMARALTKETSMAVTGNAIGPLKWMAPESIRAQQYSSRSDSWMLGVLIIETLTKEEPWPGKSSTEVGGDVVTRQMHHPIPTNASEDMKTVLLALFSFDPKSRPEAQDVAVALQRMLKSAK